MNLINSLEGIVVPLITPFQHGKIDLIAAQELANYLVYSGVQGLVIGGTTGEGCALDKNEQQLLLAAVHEAVGQHCPLLFGLSGVCTREFVDKVKRLKSDLLSGFLVSPPAYVRPSQEGLQLHFSKIAATTDLPLVLYNIPMRTGVNINVDTIIKLSQNPQFVAIKECTSQTDELLERTNIPVLCGNDETLFHDLCLGASGAISAAAHIRPDLFVHMHNLVRCGQLNQARCLFDQLLPMIKLLFSESNPAPVKAALSLQGFIVDSLRLPMTSMSSIGQAALIKEMDRVMNIVTDYNQPALLNR